MRYGGRGHEGDGEGASSKMPSLSAYLLIPGQNIYIHYAK